MPSGVYERKIKVGRQKQPIVSGVRFGRLVTIQEAEPRGIYRRALCQCDCGNKKDILFSHIKRGNIKSCGCLRYEVDRTTRIEHGEARNGKASAEYTTYYRARTRCSNPNTLNYKYWGGRGIQFRFKDYQSFLEEVGRKPTPKHSLDRIDNDGHYEKGNVRWSTPKEQANNRRNNFADKN